MGLAEEKKEKKGLGAEGDGPVYKAAWKSGHPIATSLCEPTTSSCLRNKHKQKYKT